MYLSIGAEALPTGTNRLSVGTEGLPIGEIDLPISAGRLPILKMVSAKESHVIENAMYQF